MTDVARLGFSADTSALDKAKAALRSLIPAAKGAQQATDALNASTGKTGGVVHNAAAGLNGLGVGMNKAANGAAGLSRAALMAGTAMGTIERAAVGAAAAMGTFQVSSTTAVNNVVNNLNRVPAAANSAGTALDRLGRHASDNINRMQATPGNIAAQFQDIGVTAAAGMNPMIIALQQGTQLSAAMAGGLGNLLAGLRQVFSASTLLTIGLVGLIAAGIQMVDWAKVAATVLYALADALIYVAPYALALGAALAVLYAPAIIAGIYSVIAAVVALGVAFYATVGLPLLIAAAVAVSVITIVNYYKEGINRILNMFIAGYKGIVAVWDRLPAVMGDIGVRAANALISAIRDGVIKTIELINPLLGLLKMAGVDIMGKIIPNAQIDNPWAGAAAGAWDFAKAAAAAHKPIDIVGNIAAGIEDAIKAAADAARDLAAYLLEPDAEKAKKSKVGSAARGRDTKTGTEKFADILEDAAKQKRELLQTSETIGLYGEELARATYTTDLFNKAQDAGLELLPEQERLLRDIGAELARLDEENRHANFMENIVQDAELLSLELERARGEIGLTGAALESYRYQTEILMKAKRDHIILTDAERAAIKASGDIYGVVTEQIKKMREALEFARETVGGFFKDWYKGIIEGKNIFKSFADAVVNGLNRIIDRLMDRVIDNFLDNLFGKSSGGGLLGKVFGAIVGNAGGTSVSSASAGIGGRATPNALGNVISSPTMLMGGGGLGTMAEAGPEAIMPLRRGSDGSLGVQVHGRRGQGGKPDLTVNSENHYHLNGTISANDVMAMIQQSGAQTQAEVKQQLTAWLQQYDSDGAVAA